MNEERKLYEDWLHKSPEFGETIISAWDVWIARAALSAPAVPKGFKLVPIEPTQMMKLAGAFAQNYRTSEAVYRAMLAAVKDEK